MVFGWYRKMQDWLQKKERNQRRSPHLQSFGRRRRRRLSEICPTTCLWDSIKDDPGELHFEGPGLQEGWDPGELLFRAQGLQGELHDGVTMTAKVFTNSMMKDAWQSMVLPMVSLGLVATWKKTPQKSQVMYFKTYLYNWLLLLMTNYCFFFFLCRHWLVPFQWLTRVVFLRALRFPHITKRSRKWDTWTFHEHLNLTFLAIWPLETMTFS